MSPIFTSPPSSPSIGVLIAWPSTGSAATAKPAAIAAAMKLRRSIGVSGTRLLKWSFFSGSCRLSFSMASPRWFCRNESLTYFPARLFLDRGQLRRKRAAGTALRAFGEHRLGERPVAGFQRRINKDQHKQVALGVAAAELPEVLACGREECRRARVVLAAPRDHGLAHCTPGEGMHARSRPALFERRHRAQRQRVVRVDESHDRAARLLSHHLRRRIPAGADIEAGE